MLTLRRMLTLTLTPTWTQTIRNQRRRDMSAEARGRSLGVAIVGFVWPNMAKQTNLLCSNILGQVSRHPPTQKERYSGLKMIHTHIHNLQSVLK